MTIKINSVKKFFIAKKILFGETKLLTQKNFHAQKKLIL